MATSAPPPPPPGGGGSRKLTPDELAELAPKVQAAMASLKKGRLKNLTPKQQREIGQIAFSLALDNENGYAHLLYGMNWRSLVGGDSISTITIGRDGNFYCAFNFDVLSRFSMPARKEIVKKQALKIPFGHLASRIDQLKSIYGEKITRLATQLVLNQHINTGLLAEEGVVLPLPEMYGLDGNKTTDQYCADLLEKGGGTGDTPDPTGVPVAGGFGSPGSDQSDQDKTQKMLSKMTDEDGFTNMDSTDIPDVEEVSQMLRDLSNERTIKQVDSALKSGNQSSLKAQGFWGAECQEFLDSLRKEPKLNWADLLRQKEGMHRSCEREMTKMKPSRRGNHYWGRRNHYTVRVLFVVDTSGSMSHDDLRCVDAEVRAMAARGVEVWVGNCDAASADDMKEHPPKVFHPSDKIDGFFGRGGTDFRGAFEYAEKYMYPVPDFVVYFTDGMGTAPRDQLFDTLWVLTSSGYDVDTFQKRVCSWGDCIVIDTSAD
jgi:hypothetical protein